MRAAEKSLLLAVRNRLRLGTDIGGAGFRDDQCDVEPDTDFPATAGDLYVAVMPAGYLPGQHHQKSGGVRDLIYGVKVAVVKRLGHVPRDRRTDVFINNMDAINVEVERVIAAIDWQEEVRIAANALILAETQSTEGFIHPLYLSGQVSEPQYCNADAFIARPGKDSAGMMRIIPFHGARRITTDI